MLIFFYFNKVHAMKPVDSIKKTLFFILCLIKSKKLPRGGYDSSWSNYSIETILVNHCW